MAGDRAGRPGHAARHDRQLAAELSALRSVTRLLGTGEMAASRRHALERERRRLETAVQARTRRSPGGRVQEAEEFDLDMLFGELGGSSLIELVEVDSVLHAITVANRRVRLHTVGSVPEDEIRMTRFAAAPHRAASCAVRGRAVAGLPGQPAGGLAARLRCRRARGRPGHRHPAGPAPGGAVDAHAVAARPGRDRGAVGARSGCGPVISGPRPAGGLPSSSGPGWPRAARRSHSCACYPGAVLLGKGSATAEHVLGALDGAWLAHIAAHGTFRADNPMFSSLRLDDGPLTVHDFERLAGAPYRLVLSSCDSGVAAPVGADELLGLVSSLVPLGAAGIVASVVPVNDEAAVPVMLALHDAVRGARHWPRRCWPHARRSATARWPTPPRTPSWLSAPEICALSNIAHYQLLCNVNHFGRRRCVVLLFVSFISRLFSCTPRPRGVAFHRSLPDRYVPSGLVVRSEIRGWGAWVGLQRRCLLSRGSGRTRTGQRSHVRHAPWGHHGQATAGAGQRHPLARTQRGWTAHLARGPPA